MNDREPKYHRRSIRLKGFDYTMPWWYYITICAYKRNCLFGKVVNNEVIKNEIGEVSEQCWKEIPAHFPQVILDEFIIMPNHIHGIIIIEERAIVRAQHVEPLQTERKFQNIVAGSVSAIIRSYKAAVSKKCHEMNYDFRWHRNYYEHIIRCQKDLENIRHYIHYNALKWKRMKIIMKNKKMAYEKN